jgi:hypothetical protein
MSPHRGGAAGGKANGFHWSMIFGCKEIWCGMEILETRVVVRRAFYYYLWCFCRWDTIPAWWKANVLVVEWGVHDEILEMVDRLLPYGKEIQLRLNLIQFVSP